MLKQDFALRGELDALGAADKKGLVQLFFQNLDGLADSGLGDKKLFGCFRKA